jgi:hypothetical protein
MKKILFASSILGTAFLGFAAHAQTKVIVKPKTKAATTAPYPTQNYSAPVTNTAPAPVTPAIAPPPGAPAASVVATPAAAEPPPNPWKLVYFTEWVGPRFNNFDLSQTQGPNADVSSYTTLFESLKIGYAISDPVVLGIVLRGEVPLDPNSLTKFNFYNLRFYGSWKHMIETSDIDMQQVVELEAPTTDSSRGKGLIVRFNIKNNWTIKTALRNWFISFQTLVSPRFYNTLTGSSTDLALGVFPWITLDLAADLQFVFEGSFDAGHAYQETFFDFNQGDDDYTHFGIMWSLNSHIQLNPAVIVYPSDMTPSKWGAYLSLTAAL